MQTRNGPCGDMFRLIFAVTFTACVQADFRILNGQEVTIQDYPYMASLLFGSVLVGGGAIIGPRHVLTAAHLKAGVQVGSHHYSKDGVRHTIESFDTFINSSMQGLPSGDLAVITLLKPINFTDKAQPIAIVPEGQETRHGDMLTVTGWGRTQVGLPLNTESKQLKMARLPCIDKALCKEAWKTASNGEIELDNYTLCAGGGGGPTAIFKGDSGGPLVNDKNQLVGIVSWGKKENPVFGYPGVFVNIADRDMQNYIFSRLNGSHRLN